MLQVEINGVTLPFDATDADTLDRYLKAVARCAEESRRLGDPGGDREKVVQMYRDMSRTIKNVFDDIFGAGTGEKVCGANDSLRQCCQAYKSLSEEYNRQQKEQARENKELNLILGGKK